MSGFGPGSFLPLRFCSLHDVRTQAIFYKKVIERAEKVLAKPARKTRAVFYRGRITLARKSLAALERRRDELLGVKSTETEGNADMDKRRQLFLDEEVERANANASREGLVAIADRRLDINGVIYNRGCKIPSLDCLRGPGYFAAVKNIKWVPASMVNTRIQPIRMVAALPRLPVVIKWADEETDRVRFWEKTHSDTVAGIVATGSDNGDIGIARSRAHDAMVSCPKGAEAFRLFQKQDSEQRSREQNNTMRREVRAY